MLFPTITLSLAVLAATALASPVLEKGEQCGPVVCGLAETCCNDSCGICTLPDALCTMQLCAPTGPKCGPNQCHDGWDCCNESCGICTPPGGGSCTEQFCMPEEEKPEGGLEGRGVSGDDPESKDKANLDHECQDAGEGPKDGLEGRVDSKDEPKPKIKTVDEAVQCGPSTCEKGQVCCNESCGICTPPDRACTMQFCFAEEEVKEQDRETGAEEEGGLGRKCGSKTCPDDEYCCNSSCEYCRKEGEGCTKEFCDFNIIG